MTDAERPENPREPPEQEEPGTDLNRLRHAMFSERGGELEQPEGDDEPSEAERPDESGRLAPYRPDERFRAATDDELDPQSFMVADDRSALRAVLRGGSIAEDRGDADFIGGAIRRLAQVLRGAAEQFRAGTTGMLSNALLRNVEFGHSVVVELEISPQEDVQLGLDDARHSPTIDAARALAQLLATPDTEQLRERALDLGPDVVAPYKQLLNHIAGDKVTLEMQVPDATQLVVVTSTDASHDFAVLDLPGVRRTDSVEVPGRLTMADSELHQFALTLPSDLARPPLLKGKQRVRGTYEQEVGDRLRAEGLWDSDVWATIDVTYDVPGSTPTPHDPSYVLVDAEPLIPTAPSLFPGD